MLTKRDPMHRRNSKRPAGPVTPPESHDHREAEYDLSTPIWNRYYEAMRKRIRFPRYYKKALNW